jgi:hypothetical protein
MASAGSVAVAMGTDDRETYTSDVLWPNDDTFAVELPKTLRLQRRRVIPRPPTRDGRPRADRGPLRATTPHVPTQHDDPELWAVHDALKKMDPHGIRAGYALREALDQIYDGQRTGRWDYTQLSKTEKTHVGTLVEIWLQREFDFADGDELDFSIAGVDVDCKWSLNLYAWEIPLEMYSRGNKIALVLWANEYTARWACGLIRITEDVLRPLGKQRDQKRRLNDVGRERILWVVPGADLVKNTLLDIQDEAKLKLIVYAARGQTAVTNMFRELQGVLINRAAVLTAAQQVDSAKRVRDARKHLQAEGIVIFGHYRPHPTMAAALGLPVPTLGRFVSTRLALWGEHDQEPFVEIEGQRWRRARSHETDTRAPTLPRPTDES